MPFTLTTKVFTLLSNQQSETKLLIYKKKVMMITFTKDRTSKMLLFGKFETQ